MIETRLASPSLTRVEFEACIESIAHSPSDAFVDLVAAAGLRPEGDLRFGDFSDCAFDGEALRGFDFTGCDLRRSSFAGARIKGAIFDAAKLDGGALRQAVDYEAYLKADIARTDRHRLATHRLPDLAAFREAPFAPEMVVIPAGEYMMGSDAGDAKLGDEDKAWDNEIVPGQGKRRMRIPRRFAVARAPVTFEDYDVFCDAAGHERADDRGRGRERRPVVNVSWDDAHAYVAWLNEKLGLAAYRLPSEAEWEYACRAGTKTRRWWGDAWDPARANGNGKFEGGRTSPVDHYPPNPWGLRDMIGNVWEWCADSYVGNLAELPDDGIAFQLPIRGTRTHKSNDKNINSQAIRVLRGGSWSNGPGSLRCAVRIRFQPDNHYGIIGFRLSRTL